MLETKDALILPIKHNYYLIPVRFYSIGFNYSGYQLRVLLELIRHIQGMYSESIDMRIGINETSLFQLDQSVNIDSDYFFLKMKFKSLKIDSCNYHKLRSAMKKMCDLPMTYGGEFEAEKDVLTSLPFKNVSFPGKNKKDSAHWIIDRKWIEIIFDYRSEHSYINIGSIKHIRGKYKIRMFLLKSCLYKKHKHVYLTQTQILRLLGQETNANNFNKIAEAFIERPVNVHDKCDYIRYKFECSSDNESQTYGKIYRISFYQIH